METGKRKLGKNGICRGAGPAPALLGVLSSKGGNRRRFGVFPKHRKWYILYFINRGLK